MESILIDKHGWIEASAGTGKTYTIERLVLKILKSKKVDSIGRILVVTFTEKATAELKERIRALLELEEKTESDKDTQRFLTDCLDQFDTASIFTIHGFCQRVLRDFAFENQGLFQREIVADSSSLRERCFHERLRQWPLIYPKNLPAILFILKFAQLDREGEGSSSLDTMRKLIQVLRVGRDQKLSRLTPGFPQLKFADLSIEAYINQLELGLHQLVQWLQTMMQDKTLLDCEMFLEILARRTKTGWHQTDLKSAQKIWDALAVWFKQQKSWYHRVELLDILADKIHKFPDWVQDLMSFYQDFALHFYYQEAVEVTRDFRNLKARKGLMDFDDLLFFVLEAIEGKGGEDLKQILRGLYPFVLVDEFQDTDAMQWEIFSQTFLKGTVRNTMFLIGDPKQAIYAFRGADVFTYLEARQSLKSQGRSQFYNLGLNYRSTQELISVMNALFARWFDDFVPVNAPKPSHCKLLEDKTGRAAVTLVSLKSKTPKGCAWPMAEWIGAEISQLICNQEIVHQLDGKPRSIGFQDIAILVPYRSDAFCLKRVLTRLNIPYAMYKEEGLYATEECLHLQVCLEALLNPEDFSLIRAALLTPLFGMPRAVVLKLSSLPQGHSIRTRMEKLVELAQTGRLSTLLKMLLEEGPYAKKPEWERVYTNYRQIAEQLMDRHVAYGASIADLLRHIKSLRHEAVELLRDQNLLRLPGEQARVQIMTMHMSKGLQYPVVFVAGGYTRNPIIPSVICHPPRTDGGFERVFIHRPTKDNPYYDLIRQEMEQEQLRLLYVAFTRARYKLYLPHWVPEEKASANTGYLLSTISPALYELMTANPELEIEAVCEPREVAILNTKDLITSAPSIKNPFLQGPDVSLWKVESDFYLNSRKLERRSFSGLSRLMYPDEYQFGAVRDPDEPQEPVITQFENDLELQSLPRGAEFGSLIHTLMEQVDFEKSQQLGDLAFFEGVALEYLFARHQIGIEFKEAVLRMVYQSLKVVLPMVGPDFQLIGLKNSETLREKEFWFTPVAKPGFVYGAQDFLFRFENKYWIVDWKSNWLEDYSTEGLSHCMESSHYDLQARIYGIALRRWLKAVLGETGAEQFGGILYLFLRGMKSGSLEGVYCLPQDAKDWDEEEMILEEVL